LLVVVSASLLSGRGVVSRGFARGQLILMSISAKCGVGGRDPVCCVSRECQVKSGK
jgi:hypothetical protein